MFRIASEDQGFPWKRWLLVGCLGWVALMIVNGTPIGILLTPALGPTLGWLLGGIVYLAIGIATRR